MKKTLALIGLTSMLALSTATFADPPANPVEDFYNSENCVASKWKDEFGNTISIDDKFGEGSQEVTRCLGKTKNAKILYQINTLYKDSTQTAAYAVGNIKNHITDFKTTHGMSDEDFEIVVVVHSAGWRLVLNGDEHPAVNKGAGNTNPFLTDMEELVNTPSVKVLFCQNTAHKKNIKLADMIQGIGFTTAGVSAISDLQDAGYKYIQP